MLKKKISIESARESEQGIGMKRKNEKGVDDKSQDYAREREKWCIRSWNSKIINLIVFSSVSYRISVAASCFTHHGHGLCLLFFVLLQFAGIGNIKKVCSMLFGVKSHVKFPNITSRAHTLLCTLNANYWDVIFVYAERDIISLCVYIIAKHHPMQCHAHLFICKQ